MKQALLSVVLQGFLVVGFTAGASAFSSLTIEETRQAGERGEAEAQARLGAIYALGIGVPKDKQEALRWYRLAAGQGHAVAQWNLGLIYIRGDGVPQDFALAAEWLGKAAEQGHANAQYDMGVLYLDGLGMPQDRELAVGWFRKAATNGHQASIEVLMDLGED